ncbi:MAG: cytochrome oxidase small assembly protein [Casimicrobiaceae bacterium]
MTAAEKCVRDGSRIRRANLRTGLILAAIALVFFVGIIATRFIGDSATGMSVVGISILLFLAIAIGRNLRK